MAGNAGGTAGASVCSKYMYIRILTPYREVFTIRGNYLFSATRVPFEVTFYSDGFEYASGALAESSQEQAGVNLIYRQQAC